MKNTKRIIVAALTGTVVLMMSCTVFASSAAYSLPESSNAVSVFANGEKISLTDEPFVKNGEAYVPLREFLNSTSKASEITWNDDRTLIVKNQYKNEVLDKDVSGEVYFAIDSNVIKIKDPEKNVMQKYKLQNSPLLIDSKTYIPYELIKLIDEEMRATSGIEFTVGDNADYQEMLKMTLPFCREIGIDKVLITCIDGNIGSEKTILANGGIYEYTIHEPDENVNLKRFWITL